MSNVALEKLKSFRKERSDEQQFNSVNEYLVWVDNVRPYLHFNAQLLSNFNNAVALSTLSMSQDANELNLGAVNNSIGIVNQAITMLDAKASHSTTENEIPFPSKITAVWVLKNVPIQFYLWVIGIIFSASLLGIEFSNSRFFLFIFNYLTNCYWE